jgi:tetratricopeptide (TPR) repeat protein
MPATRRKVLLSGGGIAVNEPGPVTSEDRHVSRPVFVSYATADRKEALAVCKAIERRGTACWISCRDVKPGENYQEEIVRAIRKARAMVLVFSDAANNSDEIKKELSLASKHHVPVMALRIEDVEPSDAFAYELSTRQWIDAFENWDKSVDALVTTLNQIDRRVAAPDATASQASGRRVRVANRTRTLVAASAAVALAAAGAGWFLLRPSSATAHTMQVRLTGFTRNSSSLPASMPGAMNDQIDAAFNDEGVIGVSTAAAAPPGNSPAYTLGGSIGQDGDKVNVIVRLTNERSGTTLWSNSFSYDGTNVAHVPRWAAVEVSAVVRCGLFGASTYPKALPDPVLKEYLQVCSAQSPTKGLDTAHRIVAAVPDFSWGWSAVEGAALASAFGLPAGEKRDALVKEGLAAADKAIALDPSNSEAYSLKNYLIDPNDLVGREALLKKGIAARPLACGCEHHLYGNFLMEVGRVKDALSEYARSTDVLPLNGGTQVAMAKAEIITGDPDAAGKHFDAAADLVDQPGLRNSLIVTSASLTGRYAGAAAAIQDPKFGVPDQNVKALADTFRALESGNAEQKRAATAEVNALPGDWISLPEVPLLAAMGDGADALKYTEMSVQRANSDARSWLWYPSLDAARRDPSFPALLRRLGLIHYWKATHTKPDVCSAKSPPPFCRMI